MVSSKSRVYLSFVGSDSNGFFQRSDAWLRQSYKERRLVNTGCYFVEGEFEINAAKYDLMQGSANAFMQILGAMHSSKKPQYVLAIFTALSIHDGSRSSFKCLNPLFLREFFSEEKIIEMRRDMEIDADTV